MSKSEHRPPQIPPYRGIFENKIGARTSFCATVFVELFPFVILHKLAIYIYETFFTFKVAQLNQFVSYSGI